MCNRVDRLVKIVAEYKRELPKFTCRIESLEGNMQIVCRVDLNIESSFSGWEENNLESLV